MFRCSILFLFVCYLLLFCYIIVSSLLFLVVVVVVTNLVDSLFDWSLACLMDRSVGRSGVGRLVDGLLGWLRCALLIVNCAYPEPEDNQVFG